MPSSSMQTRISGRFRSLRNGLGTGVESVQELNHVPGFSPIDLGAWLIEWKWDGIRPNSSTQRHHVSLVAWRGAHHGPVSRSHRIGRRTPRRRGARRRGARVPRRAATAFSALQQRIGRQKQVARKARDVPVVFMTFAGRAREPRHSIGAALGPPAHPRSTGRICRTRLCSTGCREGADGRVDRTRRILPFEDESDSQPPVAASRVLQVSSTARSIAVRDWEESSRLRRDFAAHGVEGLMLKRLDSPYGVGRKRGDWWKWKINPFTVDAVLIYAQPGSGKRASLLTDYTFGVWDQGSLSRRRKPIRA